MLVQNSDFIIKQLFVYIETMLGKASRWHKANNLRNYIKAVEEREIDKKDSIELREWLDWARKKVDWYDPSIESKDILLDEVDKKHL